MIDGGRVDDRAAQRRMRAERVASYRRLVERLEDELERQPGSGPPRFAGGALRASGDWTGVDGDRGVGARPTGARSRGAARRHRYAVAGDHPERARQTGAPRETEMRTAWDDIRPREVNGDRAECDVQGAGCCGSQGAG
jgi:hypothetical protein